MRETSVLSRLEADGLVRPGPGGARTTARWQEAMARAAHRLYRGDAPWQDLRLPITAALLDTYGSLPDVDLADLVEAMLPIEQSELRGAEPDQAAGKRAWGLRAGPER